MSNYRGESNYEAGHASNNFMYFMLGGLVGAGIALLLAPQSGEETRNLLAQKTQEGKEYLKHKGQELTSQVTQKGQELKEQAADYVDRGLRSLEEQKERLSRAAEAGQEAYKRNPAV